MERVICPICKRSYASFTVYRKHAKRKHKMVFKPKKSGPVRTFMPDAPDDVRKKELGKKSQEKNRKKRTIEGYQLRLACHVIKCQNQSDQDLLTQLLQTSQAIVDEYILNDDNITLQLAGYQLLHLDWNSHADISLLWPHGHDALSSDPPARFYNKKSRSSLKTYSQKQKQTMEGRREAAATRKYHDHISNTINTFPELFMNPKVKSREKLHVRKYRILAQRYLLRHPQYLPEVARIPASIITKAQLRNSRSRNNNANIIEIDINEGNDGTNDYIDDHCFNEDNSSNGDSSNDELGDNAHATTTLATQNTTLF